MKLKLMHIYIESRKMVQVNLFAGQEWRCRHREWTCGHCGERGGGMGWELTYIYTTMCKIDS